MRTRLERGESIYTLPLRVAFYARVSTDKDEQLHSLGAQFEYFSKLIGENPVWSDLGGYIDEGLSGTNAEKRPDFMRMIADAREHRFDLLLTKEISRFARNTLDSLQYTRLLLGCGVGVYFLADNINTLLPDAELRLTIMASIAQDEVRKLSERVRFGFRRAVEKGAVLGSDNIWGYTKARGRLVVDKCEADVVRRVFTLYAEGELGMRALARRLAQENIYNRSGGEFSVSTLKNIITNPKYKGWYCGGKSCKRDYKLPDIERLPPKRWVCYASPQTVPPLVSAQLWQRANDVLERRSQRRLADGGYHERYRYSGLVRCGEHQENAHRAVYRSGESQKEVWQCRRYAAGGAQQCTAPVIYTSELDEAVRWAMRLVYERGRLGERLAALLQSAAVQRRRRESKRTDPVVLKRKLAELYLAGVIDAQELGRRAAVREDVPPPAQPENLPGPARVDALFAAELAERAEPTAELIRAFVSHFESGGNRAAPELRAFFSLPLGSVVFALHRRRGKTSLVSVKYTCCEQK